MERAINAPYSGVVSSLAFAAGDQIEAGAILVVVEPDRP
jgi:biotin carboxyl carrier protein